MLLRDKPYTGRKLRAEANRHGSATVATIAVAVIGPMPGCRWRPTSAGAWTSSPDGRRFRILAVIDDCTRECLALIATSISGRRVARELDGSVRRRGRRPDAIVSDN